MVQVSAVISSASRTVPYAVVLNLSLRLVLKVEAPFLGEAFATRKPPLGMSDLYTERALYGWMPFLFYPLLPLKLASLTGKNG
jgi:hypothetical protein